MTDFCASKNAGCEKKRLMKLKLMANDETLFEVDEDVAFQSQVIRDMFNVIPSVCLRSRILQVLHISDPKSDVLDEPIPISHLDGKILRKVSTTNFELNLVDS